MWSATSTGHRRSSVSTVVRDSRPIVALLAIVVVLLLVVMLYSCGSPAPVAPQPPSEVTTPSAPASPAPNKSNATRAGEKLREVWDDLNEAGRDLVRGFQDGK